MQHLFVGVEGGEHDHLRRVRPRAQPSRRGDPVHRRHAEVHQDDVRPGPPHQFLGLRAVGGLPDDLDVLGPADHQRQTGAYQGVVVHEEESDRRRSHGVT